MREPKELVKRAAMIAATPFVHVAHHMGWLGYAWVNRCLAARRPDLFDPIYQHQWFGTPIQTMPEEVVLRGIGYRVAVSEGTVTFVCECFSRTRITFSRDPYEPAELWYVAVSGNLPASHVTAAYAWVCAVYGGSFVAKREPVAARPERVA